MDETALIKMNMQGFKGQDRQPPGNDQPVSPANAVKTSHQASGFRCFARSTGKLSKVLCGLFLVVELLTGWFAVTICMVFYITYLCKATPTIENPCDLLGYLLLALVFSVSTVGVLVGLCYPEEYVDFRDSGLIFSGIFHFIFALVSAIMLASYGPTEGTVFDTARSYQFHVFATVMAGLGVAAIGLLSCYICDRPTKNKNRNTNS